MTPDLSTALRDAPPREMPPRGWPAPTSAYLHVPFCRHRCGYCNFSVIAGRDDLAEKFLSAIEIELQLAASDSDPAPPLKTLFLGGGTPTHLSLAQLDRLMDAIDRWLPRAPDAETSVEANPEDIDDEKVRLLEQRGVNRISLGVQSFNERKLRVLQRTHTGESAARAIEQCANQIANVSIDLIFAAPQESRAAWQADLRTALRLPITHLSTYALTFEKGTSFWSERLRGRLDGAGEEDELAMYLDAIEQASDGGLAHYEISSFAKAEFRCRHNLAYWQGHGWSAFGPGAARFVRGVREVNHRSTTTYLRKVLSGQSPVAESEPLTRLQYASERAAFGIRMIDGVDLATIHEESGIDIETVRREAIETCIRHGWLDQRGTHYRLTSQGILMADSVASALLG